MNDEIVLQTHSIGKSYKKHMVLDDTNITVHRGDIYGFVGKNGAGKTTLIRILSGLARQDRGEFTLLGVSGNDKAIHQVRRRVATMVESPAIYPELSATENMKIQSMILQLPPNGIEECLEFVGLAECGKRKAKDFSLGMRQRLAIAMALLGNPELMLLDEPINGLDPEGIKAVRELLLKLNREKKVTILISSHILTELSLFATKYGFIANGKIVREVTREEIFEATAERCSLETDHNELALQLLKQMGYQAKIKNEKVEVTTDVDLMKVCETFQTNGIRLERHIHAAMDLEEYFMKLLEGQI